MSLFSGLGKILKVAAPIAGFALGGPLGSMIGGGVSSLIGGAQKSGQGDKNRQQAEQIAMQRYQSLAPLRAKALAMAERGFGGQRPNLSAGFASGNPFQRIPQQVLPAQPSGIGGAMQERGLGGPPGLAFGGGGPQVGPGNPDASGRLLGRLGPIMVARQRLAARQRPVAGPGMGGMGGPPGMGGMGDGVRDQVLQRRDQELV